MSQVTVEGTGCFKNICKSVSHQQDKLRNNIAARRHQHRGSYLLLLVARFPNSILFQISRSRRPWQSVLWNCIFPASSERDTVRRRRSPFGRCRRKWPPVRWKRPSQTRWSADLGKWKRMRDQCLADVGAMFDHVWSKTETTSPGSQPGGVTGQLTPQNFQKYV